MTEHGFMEIPEALQTIKHGKGKIENTMEHADMEKLIDRLGDIVGLKRAVCDSRGDMYVSTEKFAVILMVFKCPDWMNFRLTWDTTREPR